MRATIGLLANIITAGVHTTLNICKKCCFIKNGKRRCKSSQAGMENWIGLFLKNNKLKRGLMTFNKVLAKK